jgi:hypothetical protein
MIHTFQHGKHVGALITGVVPTSRDHHGSDGHGSYRASTVRQRERRRHGHRKPIRNRRIPDFQLRGVSGDKM